MGGYNLHNDVYTNDVWAPAGIASNDAVTFYNQFQGFMSDATTLAVMDSVQVQSFGLRHPGEDISADNPFTLTHTIFLTKGTKTFQGRHSLVDRNSCWLTCLERSLISFGSHWQQIY